MRIKFEVEVDRMAEGLGVSRFSAYHKPANADDFRRRVAANNGRIISETECSVAEAIALLKQ